MIARQQTITDEQVRMLVRASEDAWNRRDLDAVLLASSIDCHWRFRTEFLWGRAQIRAFLLRRWGGEFEHRMIKELWAWEGNRAAVRLACEFRDGGGDWFRAYGSEAWEWDASGLLRRRLTCVNEHAIPVHERVLLWPGPCRPADCPPLSELGF